MVNEINFKSGSESADFVHGSRVSSGVQLAGQIADASTDKMDSATLAVAAMQSYDNITQSDATGTAATLTGTDFKADAAVVAARIGGIFADGKHDDEDVKALAEGLQTLAESGVNYADGEIGTGDQMLASQGIDDMKNDATALIGLGKKPGEAKQAFARKADQ